MIIGTALDGTGDSGAIEEPEGENRQRHARWQVLDCNGEVNLRKLFFNVRRQRRDPPHIGGAQVLMAIRNGSRQLRRDPEMTIRFFERKTARPADGLTIGGGVLAGRAGVRHADGGL